MNFENYKCVMVLDEDLPQGILCNTSAIMGITLGKYISSTVGENVVDQDDYSHLGIIQFPVPILKASKEKIKEIRETLYEDKYQEMVVVDFSDVAQSCNDYQDFIEKMKNTNHEDIDYFGVAMCGSKKLVNKLTGSLPLLR